jgi:DNA-directed RNA polymerase subunit RPC12/RpoP
VLSDNEDFEMSEIRNDGYDDTITCFDCGSSVVSKELLQQVFQYGNGKSAVNLTAEVPVYTCRVCGYQFAGPEADDGRHEAVCRYLGVFTPQEIVAIRERTGLSRNQFAERTRIGIASLQRWETGVLIQNPANNELIYLMAFPENLKRLRERDHHGPLNLSSLSSASEAASLRRRPHQFRGRVIKPDSELVRCSQEWPLRVCAV